MVSYVLCHVLILSNEREGRERGERERETFDSWLFDTRTVRVKWNANIQLFFLYAIVAYESPHTLEPHKSFCFRVKRGSPLPVSLSPFSPFLSLLFPPPSLYFSLFLSPRANGSWKLRVWVGDLRKLRGEREITSIIPMDTCFFQLEGWKRYVIIAWCV